MARKYCTHHPERSRSNYSKPSRSGYSKPRKSDQADRYGHFTDGIQKSADLIAGTRLWYPSAKEA